MPMQQKTLKQDRIRIKCGACGFKLFDIHLNNTSNMVELSCHKCHEICVKFPRPKNKEDENAKTEIDKPIQT